MTKRITVAEIKKAYESTGMKPVQGGFLRGNKHCCPLFVCFMSRNKLKAANTNAKLEELINEDREYFSNFWQGVDDYSYEWRVTNVKYLVGAAKKGYYDGFKVAEEFFKEEEQCQVKNLKNQL